LKIGCRCKKIGNQKNKNRLPRLPTVADIGNRQKCRSRKALRCAVAEVADNFYKDKKRDK